MQHTIFFIATLLASVSLCSDHLHADIVISISETQLGVTMEASGSIDTNLLVIVNDGVVFSRPLTSPAPFAEIEARAYSLPTATGPLLTADFEAYPDTGLGDGILIDTNFGIPALFLSDTYVANEPLSVVSNYQSETLFNLGLTPGTHVWNFGGQTVTANITAVPEPSMLAFLGIATTAVAIRRKRNHEHAEQ